MIQNNMEELKSTFSKQDKTKSVVRRGKGGGGRGGGGGIGVGIIVLGGAVASATAAFLIGRRLRKSSSNSKNCNREGSTPSGEIPYKFLEDINRTQGKDPPFVAPDSSPYTTDADQNLSNGTARIGVHVNDNIIASDQSFFPDQEEYKVESNGGRGDSIPDGEEIIHSIPSRGSVSIMQFDASAIKEEESALADHLSREKFEMIQEDDSINTTLVDQGAEEEDKLMRDNIEGEEIEINCCADEDMRKPITTLQCGEEQESASHCGQESESTSNPSICKDERLESEASPLAFETVEVIQTDETLHAAQDAGDTMTQVTEILGSLCTESFGENNINEKLEGSHEHLAEEENKCDHHDCSLNTGTDKEIKGNETTEAIDEDEHRSAMILTSEGQGKFLVDSLTTGTLAVMEEVEMLDEAEGKDVKFVSVEVDNGAQHDKGISSEESQATGEKAHFPDDFASTGQQQKLQTRDGDSEDSSVSDEETAPDSSYEDSGATLPKIPLAGLDIPAQLKPEIAIDDGFTEVQLSAEANEARKENFASETAGKNEVLESENLQMQLFENQQHIKGGESKQLEEVEDTFQVKYADNVTIEEHNLMRPVEDSLDDEGDDSADGHIAEKVEECSEGTGDSSMESNTELIWPAESLEEVSMEHKELKIYEQKEEEQTEEDPTLKTQAPIYLEKIENDGMTDNSNQKRNDQKGNSNLTFLKKAMLELEEQIHQQTYSRKLRILIPTLSVLSWAFCLWHFGLPFLKISLIIILIQFLSKIQGF